jgi:hypothetical protein
MNLNAGKVMRPCRFFLFGKVLAIIKQIWTGKNAAAGLGRCRHRLENLCHQSFTLWPKIDLSQQASPIFPN